MRTARILLAAVLAILLTAPAAQAQPNQPPVTTNDSYTVAQGHLLTVDAPGVLANDSDPEGDIFAVTSFSGGSHAYSFGVNGNGSMSYQPEVNFFGTDTLSYVVEDNTGATSTGTVTITVTKSQTPVPVDDHYTIGSGMELHVSAPGFLANDSDPDDDGFFSSVVTDFSHGTHDVDPFGSLNYVPDSGFLGTDTLTYRLIDSNSSVSGVATITVTVVENDPPVAVNDHYTVVAGQPLTVPAPGFLANDTDPDGDTLTGATFGSFSHAASAGFFATGQFYYTSEPGFLGDDTVTYYAKDAYGTASGTATITVTVVPADAAVTLVDDEYAATEGETLTIDAPGVLSNDVLPEGSTLAPCTEATHGTATCHADGSLTFTPDAGFVGDATFSYTVDGPVAPASRVTAAAVADPALVTIHVAAAAQPGDPADPSGPSDDDKALPDTGSQLALSLPIIGGLLLLAGMLVLRRARRSRHA